jgi:hypothetical protein
MGRKSIAEKLCAQVEKIDPRPRKRKLVIYDFAGTKIPSKFFDNLKRVFELTQDGRMLQYSAVITDHMHTALVVMELAKHYGCRAARIYAVEEIA